MTKNKLDKELKKAQDKYLKLCVMLKVLEMKIKVLANRRFNGQN